MQSRYAPTHSLDWNDLRYLLAVADAGSLSAAAKALQVNHSTVLRRIGAFEKQLGLRLFERSPTGYELTAGGEELSQLARQIADTVSSVERRVIGQDFRLSGSVRVATTDTLGLTVLPPLLAKFRSTHSQVQIELVTGNSQADLTRRDADVALRPTAQPPEQLLGRRIARLAYAIYASPSYLIQHPARQPLAKHTWVAPDESMVNTQVGVYMTRSLRDAAISFKANSLVTLARAATAGLGAAVLPCYVGDSIEALRRIRGPLPNVAIDLWLLTHPDLRKTARVRAIIDFLASELVQQQDLIEGRRPIRAVKG